MINDIKLLEFIKWYSDKEHPITQHRLKNEVKKDIERAKENGEKITEDYKEEWFGYKETFRKHLIEIIETLNKEAVSVEEQRIVISGNIINATEKGDSKRNYIGKFYYQHEIDKYELRFLVNQIQGSNMYTAEQKDSFVKRLIKNLGNKYFAEETFSEIKEVGVGSAADAVRLASNLKFIKNAIEKKKMIEFCSMRLTEDGKYVRNSGLIWFSPYKIIFHKGYYWLLGNRRLGEYKYQGWDYISYSDSMDVFRIDKLCYLSIVKERNEKKAHYGICTERWLEELEHTFVYQEDEKITDVYERVEFEILWENFSQNQKYDYSFIKNTFGEDYEVEREDGRIIVGVHASVNYFVQWVMPYVDRVRILDVYEGKKVKECIRKVLKAGMKNVE